MDFIFDLIGRFHPLIVHLPIGFLLLGLMMLVFDRKENSHRKIIRFAFFWGTFSTLVAVLTGTLQYAREGYPWEDIQWHLIMGVLTFVFSFLMYLKLKGYPFFNRFSYRFLGYGLVMILFVTGHLGGNLTHGKDHLIEPLPPQIKQVLGRDISSKKLVLSPDNYQQLSLYSGVIQPILDQKCVSCHNPKKTKGELLLHNFKGIMSGGEEGSIISILNPQQSEMLKRIHLPRDEKKHMPPKAKTQLSKAEIKLIEEWIGVGASENSIIADLGFPTALFTSFFPTDETGIYPDIVLEPIKKSFIDSLVAMGLQVAPIYKTSPLLKISAINTPDFDDQKSVVLLKALDHIVDIDLGQTQVSDAVFDVLKQLKHLTVLKLNHTAIKGSGINQLNTLEHLKQINLVNSKFEDSHLEQMYSFPALEKVYLFGTPSMLSAMEIPDQYQSLFVKGDYKLDEEVEKNL
jgi:uncharacterized membrane protein